MRAFFQFGVDDLPLQNFQTFPEITPVFGAAVGKGGGGFSGGQFRRGKQPLRGAQIVKQFFQQGPVALFAVREQAVVAQQGVQLAHVAGLGQDMGRKFFVRHVQPCQNVSRQQLDFLRPLAGEAD